MKFAMTAAFAMLATLAPSLSAQERTVDDVKRDVQRRVAQKQPPFDDVRPEEVERVLSALTTLDKDEWGKRWCEVGLASRTARRRTARERRSRKGNRQRVLPGVLVLSCRALSGAELTRQARRLTNIRAARS